MWNVHVGKTDVQFTTASLNMYNAYSFLCGFKRKYTLYFVKVIQLCPVTEHVYFIKTHGWETLAKIKNNRYR